VTKRDLAIVPYDAARREAVLALTLRAWAPVFPMMREDMPAYIYDAFYPQGWQTRQSADIDAVLEDGETDIRLALLGDDLAGFIGLRAHAQDRMGEVYVIAVDPDRQRQGIGAALLDFALDWMRERDLAIAMVETGGDRGHAPARAAYEGAGFTQLPIARFFRKL